MIIKLSIIATILSLTTGCLFGLYVLRPVKKFVKTT